MRNVIAIILVLASARAAGAQSVDAQAEVLFRQGKELMAAGKLAEACAAFDESQRLDPTMATLLNQANCREKNGQLATAWRLFLEAARQVRGATAPAQRQMHAVAVDRAARLQPRLSVLRLDIPAGHQVEGLELLRDGEVLDPATWSEPTPLDGGTYQITARAPGHDAWSIAVEIAKERDARTIEIPKLRPVDLARASSKMKRQAPSATRATPPARTPPARDDGPSDGPSDGSLWSTKRKLAAGAAGGGVLALTVGTVLGVSAKRHQRDARALCPDPELACDDAGRANALIRSGHNRAIAANVAFGVGAAAAITAGVLWVTGAPESRRRVELVPAASPGQLGVTAIGRF